MATGPITSWQTEGGDMEAVTDFPFLGSFITVDGDSSYEIKRHLLLGRKTMPNLNSILKSRDVTLPTKVWVVKAMVFPVVMYRSESWTIKKADRRRIDAGGDSWQEGLACSGSWGHEELDMTKRLNNNNKNPTAWKRVSVVYCSGSNGSNFALGSCWVSLDRLGN